MNRLRTLSAFLLKTLKNAARRRPLKRKDRSPDSKRPPNYQ